MAIRQEGFWSRGVGNPSPRFGGLWFCLGEVSPGLTHLNFPLCNSENLIIKKQKNPLSPAPNHREERFFSDLDAWT
ncbi:MAG: hypothetical protein WCD79_06705, partial [Chthoniobacteraceae bacterium]